MIQIKPVSDLRNNYKEIETIVNMGEPVYLTKNGYGSMVVLSLENYAKLTDRSTIEDALREADLFAELSPERLSKEEVLSKIRSRIDGYRN